MVLKRTGLLSTLRIVYSVRPQETATDGQSIPFRNVESKPGPNIIEPLKHEKSAKHENSPLCNHGYNSHCDVMSTGFDLFG